MTDVLTQKIAKHSVMIAGHTTSVSLEPLFWDALKRLAERDGQSINQLITDIDERRGTNLSSALRLYVLDNMLRQNS